MKNVIQLDDYGYFVGTTIADESPLEPGIYLIPSNALDVEPPVIPAGHTARWDKACIYEPIPAPIVEPVLEPAPLTYVEQRALAYPPITDYLDGIVKGDQVQIDTYIASCLAVKAEYPKP